MDDREEGQQEQGNHLVDLNLQTKSNGQQAQTQDMLVQQQQQHQLNGETADINKASDSLTLEDIDEVLSNGTNNNWIEDSAGVIGTQEVYNDPRHKIVRERERPNPNVNIEKLSFQEKLKMFNESAEKP